MLTKNTVIDLWEMFRDIPLVQNDNNQMVIDDPEGFLGWPQGTDEKVVWEWFNKEFTEYGGITALMYNCPATDRKFQVETPVGILEVYAKHEGKDCSEDYPGVYIDLRHTDEQKSGIEIGDLICCVEYDSMQKRMQIVPYADLGDDSPSLGDYGDSECPVLVIEGLNDTDFVKKNSDPIPIEQVEDEHDEEKNFKPSFWWNNRRYYLDDFIRCHDNPWIGNAGYPEYIHAYEADNYYNPLYIELIGDSAVNIWESV